MLTPLSNLSTHQLDSLLRLLREKEALQAKLAKIAAEIDHLDAPPVITSPRLTRRPRKRRRRAGKTRKDSVLEVLAKAGPTGLSVQEIANQAKIKLGSVSVWLYTTGKKVPGLKKVSPGRYTYQPK